MWVLATNSLARGITDTSIASGAAAALIYGATRVEAGAMSLSALLIILMLGIEIFRPMRELRTVLHQGMVGPLGGAGHLPDPRRHARRRRRAAGAPRHMALAPTIAFEDVGFAYPGTRRTVHDGLSFRAEAGERLGTRRPLRRRQVLDRAAAAALLRSRPRPHHFWAATISAACRSPRSAR